MNENSAERKESTLVGLVMRRPITICVLALAVMLGAAMGLKKMPRDILPNLGVPVIYVAQPYGGLDPGQMESYLTYYYEYHFLYISGIEHIESKNIESTALIKLLFHPGTDMAAAMAETVAEVDRSRAFMPPGTLPPFVIRFDAGSEPVGKLVFSSETKTLGELQNYALNQVRPLFANLEGVSAPPPFGASARTIVIEVDPKKLQANDLDQNSITNALITANTIIPSGNIHSGTLYPLVPINSIVNNPPELLDLPLRLGRVPATLLRDVGRIIDSTDIETGFALVNGRRTVYIPVTKRADASTLAVVDRVKANISKFQDVLPRDIKVSFEFDQSGYVRRAISSLFVEALLGAVFTGFMVLLFLRDWRSVLIVVFNIPMALLSSILCLWICGQTANIMTLGGLALAVGILVDETTVTIENIHAHLAKGVGVGRATLDATNEILTPALLTLLCVLSVFIPSFFMEGVIKALFVPLTLAVGFAMIASFTLSRTIVPVFSTWFLHRFHEDKSQGAKGFFVHLRQLYLGILEKLLTFKRSLVLLYLALAVVVTALVGTRIGIEIFPRVDAGQFQLRLKARTGTSIENTEKITLKVIDLIKEKAGPENVETTIAFVGTQPPNYAISTVYLWTAGPQEAVLEVSLHQEAKIKLENLKEELRQSITQTLPDIEISFEPSSLVDRTMSQGSTTPLEIAVSGSSIDKDHEFAGTILNTLKTLPFLRDIQIVQRLDYPTIEVDADRKLLGYMGLDVLQLGQALIPATSSSRYVAQNYWRDRSTGINYQVQVQVPEDIMSSPQSLGNIPIQASNGDVHPLKYFAKLNPGKKVGEFDRYDMQRMISVTANLHGIDLGHASRAINKSLNPIVKMNPKGTEIRYLGQIPALAEMMNGLSFGLSLAILAVFLLLSANFESVSLSFCVLSTTPAVIAGSLTLLFLTETTLNIESFMGIIMSVGVAVANAILLVTFAERARKVNADSRLAAKSGAGSRFRPILMTSGAMLVGMMPMASGFGEGGGQTAPLGRAVIGGVLGSTVATLFILPLVFTWIQQTRKTQSASLDPDDKESIQYEQSQP